MLLYKKHKGVDDVKHLRKTVSILALSAALLCVLCSVAFAASNNDSAFAVSESGAAGDIINVDVYLSGKDIGSVYIDLEYDNTALEFVSARTFVAGLRFNYNSSTVLSGGNTVRFTGSVDSYDAINVNGAVMRVEFKILKSIHAVKSIENTLPVFPNAITMLTSSFKYINCSCEISLVLYTLSSVNLNKSVFEVTAPVLRIYSFS